MPEILQQLYAASFDGIIFPVTDVSESGQMETQQLTPVQGSGGYIETIRRMSDTWVFTVPMYSPIKSGGTEDDFTNLFPVRLEELMNAFRKGDPADLVHPLRGAIKAKAIDWNYVLNAGERNGTMLKVTFTEHVEEQAEVKVTFKATAAVEAASLYAGWNEQPEPPPDLFESIEGTLGELEGLSNQITGAIEAPERLAESIGSKVDRASNCVEKVAGALNKAGNEVADYATFMMSLHRVEEAAYNAQQNKNQSRPTKFYVVPGETALPAVAGFLQNSMEEIVELNPHLAKSIVVKADTLINYYTG